MNILIPLDSSIQERIWQAFLMNLGYHMFYYSTSTAHLIQLKWFKENSTNKAISRQFFLVMSCLMIGICVLAAPAITYIALSSNNYEQLFALALLPGVILGAIKLIIRLKKNNKRTTTTE